MFRASHLRRRGNQFYYHRRVPLPLVDRLGKSTISFSLGTADPEVAAKKRDLEDLKYSAQFSKSLAAPASDPIALGMKSLSVQAIIRMVKEYVETTDSAARQSSLAVTFSAEEHAEERQGAEIGRSILGSGDNPSGPQWVYTVSEKIVGHPLGALDHSSQLTVQEVVRRALLELQDRRLLRLDSDFGPRYVNPMFNPTEVGAPTFGEVAAQYLQFVEEEARENGTSQKWVDQQKGNTGLLSQIVGADISIKDIDHDACPYNRNGPGGYCHCDARVGQVRIDRLERSHDPQVRRKRATLYTWRFFLGGS